MNYDTFEKLSEDLKERYVFNSIFETEKRVLEILEKLEEVKKIVTWE
jgi:ribosome-binding factor A